MKSQSLYTLIVAACFAWTSAIKAETYAILPLVGDHLTVVTAFPTVGSHQDQNRYEAVPVTDTVFDDIARTTVEASIRELRPAATVVLLRVNDASPYAAAAKLADGNASEIGELLELLKGKMPDIAAGRAILILPFRAQPNMRARHGYFGTGKVAGLGFYVSRLNRVRRSDTGELGEGYLGVFANFRLVLVDIQTRAVLAQEVIEVGTIFSSARAAERDPWNALSAQQKVAAVGTLMRGEIERRLPKLLDDAGP